MSDKCYLIDVDNTIFKHGTEEPLSEEIIKKINDLYDQGHQVWLFTCRPSNGVWVQIALKRVGLKFHGVLSKPLASEYYYIDDRFAGGGTAVGEIL